MDGPTGVRWIADAQQWAIDVIVQARLRPVAYAALCIRGEPGPLWAFLPSSAFAY